MKNITMAVVVAGLVLALPGARAEEVADAGAWKSEVVGGVAVTDGNSETMVYNVGVATERKQGAHEFKAGAAYNYGETTVEDSTGESVDNKTADNIQGAAQYNRLFNERLFGFVKLTGLSDDLALIDYRFIGGPGLGYYVVKSATRSLALEAGPSYLAERVDGEDDEALLLRVAERFEQTFESGAKIWQAAEYMPQADDFDVYLLNAEVGAEAILSGNLNLRVVAQDRYDSEPALDREKNVLTVTAAVVVKL